MLDIDYFDDGADKFSDGTDKNTAFQELLDPAAYKGYLQTMAHFHNYSIRNILLIYKQMPQATRLAAYGAWQKQKRNVKKGSKSIKILSPKPAKPTGVLAPKINPETGSPLLDADGKKVLEELTHSNVEFEEVTVFDISQTYGKPIQKLNDNPATDEAMKLAFFDALKAIIAQSDTHDESPELTQDKLSALIDRLVKAKTIKVEADGAKPLTFPQVGERFVHDSIVFVLCRKFGLDIGGFSFEFISALREEILPILADCLADCLDTIKTEASSLITAIEDKFIKICEEKGLNPMIDYEPNTAPSATLSIPTGTQKAAIQKPAIQKSTIQKPAIQKSTIQKPVKQKPTAQEQKEIPQPPLYNVIERNEKTALGVDFTHYDIIPVKPVTDVPDSTNEDEQQIQTSVPHISTTQTSTLKTPTSLTPPETPIRRTTRHTPKHTAKHIPPDPLITIADREKYGYNRRGELLPITKERARNLYRRNMSIYALYSDNREAMIFHHSEIEAHNGIFAVPHSEWSVCREYLALASGDPEAQQEAAFLYDSKNAFAVYQLREPQDTGYTAPNESTAPNGNTEPYHYIPYEQLTDMGLFVSKENYRLAYTGHLLPSDSPEKIFMRFNMEKPDGYTGKSMGISDVLSIQENSVIASHYVDRGRYTELISFTGEEGRSARRRMEDENIERTTTQKAEKMAKPTQSTAEPHAPSAQPETAAHETAAQLQQSSQSKGNENETATTDIRQSETTPSSAKVATTENAEQSDNLKNSDATAKDTADSNSNTELNALPPPDNNNGTTALDKLSETMQDLTDFEVYPLSLAEAKKDGKEDVYELNLTINYNCTKDIDRHIRASKVKNSEGEYRILDAVKKTVVHYGRKRVAWVLAVAVKNADSNTFSKDNEYWAIQHLKVTGYPKEPATFSLRTAPVLLDAFINRFREIENDPKPFYEERIKSAEKRMKLQANNKPQQGM